MKAARVSLRNQLTMAFPLACLAVVIAQGCSRSGDQVVAENAAAKGSTGDSHVALEELRNSRAAPPGPAQPNVNEPDPKPAPLPNLNILNAKGFSQLHLAAMEGRVDRVRQLLAAGANVDVQQGEFHGTPLQYAAAKGHGEAAQALIDGEATVDAADTQGRTPLVWAATGGHSEVIRKLLDAGATIDAATGVGWTALHFAVHGKHQEAAQLLIDRGADPYARNSKGKTPLDLAPAAMNLKVSPRRVEADRGATRRNLAPFAVRLIDEAVKLATPGGMTHARKRELAHRRHASAEFLSVDKHPGPRPRHSLSSWSLPMAC